MSDKKRMRKHLFVDPKVQGILAVRVALYWALCLVSVSLTLLCWQALAASEGSSSLRFGEMWWYYKLALIASFVLLPLVVLDVIRFSNQFVGPLLRLRRSMRELARGQYVEPIEFRGNDFWPDIAEEFNAIRARVLAAPAVAKADFEDEEPACVRMV